MTQTRVTPGTFKRLTAGPGQFALAIGACLLLVAGVFLITPGSGDDRELRKSVVYTWDAKAMARAAPFEVFVPDGLPARWQANSSRLTGTDATTYPVTGTPVTWHLGFATPADQYAALEQSNERAEGPGGWIRRMTNTPQGLGTMTINGQAWEKYYQKDKKQFSLVSRRAKNTVIVTGSADFPELSVLAGSLTPQARP
ncbi:MAG: DUF4245 domain-containing protein [Streptosporangiaceae bacterium]